MTKILRIATRKSPLALWQAEHVGNMIKQHWPDLTIELVPMLTSGDRFLKDKLQSIGGKGLFVKELEEALLDNRADVAVHSMKDVPAALPAGLELATICKRDNPFDALVTRDSFNLETLPLQSIIGTTSLRRQAQLLAIRPDLIIKPLRGNIQTRLNKLNNGDFDAILLAVAGLQRMNLQEQINEILNDKIMLPACGQGALGIECRVADNNIHQLIAPLNDSLTATCVYAERQVNAILGGSCHIPLAVYCYAVNAHQLVLRAKVMTTDGQTIIADSQSGNINEAVSLADKCAENLINQGALQLIAQAHDHL